MINLRIASTGIPAPLRYAARALCLSAVSALVLYANLAQGTTASQLSVLVGTVAVVDAAVWTALDDMDQFGSDELPG